MDFKGDNLNEMSNTIFRLDELNIIHRGQPVYKYFLQL